MEVILTIIGLSFWFLFPIGMFLAVSRLDKDTDQVVRLSTQAEKEKEKEKIITTDEEQSFDWHHPILHFKRWLHQP